MRNLKLAFESHHLDGKPQGITAYLIGVIEALSRFDHVELYVFCRDKDTVRTKLAERANVHIIQIDSKIFYYFELFKETRRLSLDFMFWQYYALPFAKVNVPVIHDILPITHPKLFSIKFLILRMPMLLLNVLISPNIVTVSEYSRNKINKFRPFWRRTRVQTTPNATNLSLVRSQIIEDLVGVDYILSVGRFDKRKNQKLFVEAFDLFQQSHARDCRLVLVGSGQDYKRVVLQLVLERKLTDRVHFIEASDGQLKWLYQNCRLFVNLSKYEGFCIPLLEAIVMGAAVISPVTTALKQFEKYIDYQLEDLSAESVAEAIRIGLASRGSRLNSEEAKKEYSWNVAAKILLEMCNDR